MSKSGSFIIAALALVACVASASAQFRVGPRVGVALNTLRFDKSAFNSDNRAGVTAGLQAEFTIPVINLAFDASVMYTRRSAEAPVSTVLPDGSIYRSRDFVNIPVNIKFKFGIPVVGKIITPYIFTGPDFAFLTSWHAVADDWTEKKVDIAWNIGVGLQLIEHLHISASHGFGMSKYIDILKPIDGKYMSGRNNYWTVTAAWLF
ncbi:MAG: PorT family protein [Muribaculaceae bacterium]|nr:PorT family protein [Muribaculaceae bacterium]